MTRLSLDCLTLTNTRPADLIRAASAAGFDLISLWINPPAAYPSQLVTPNMVRECASVLADTGIRIQGMEAFDMVSAESVRAFRPSLEIGAHLGGRTVLAYHGENPDRTQVVNALAAFVELANEYGLGVNFEPVAMGQTKTLAQAQALIRDARVDAGILFDSYHLVRSGGSAADLRTVAPGVIRYVQINDGPTHVPQEGMLVEASSERLYPGEGSFPLVDLLRSVPTDVPWGIEAPSLRRARAGLSPHAQAQEAMQALQRLLKRVGDPRIAHR